jgi:hypothetical protein
MCKCFNFGSCNSKINTNQHSVNYLKGIELSQLILVEKTGLNNLGCETHDLVISQSSSSRKQT